MNLIEQIIEIRTSNNYGKATMAKMFEVEWQTYHNWERRKSLPKNYIEKAQEIIRLMSSPQGVREAQAEYIAGMEEWDSATPVSQEEVSVPFFSEVEAAAGAGNFVQENHGPKLRFAKSTLRNAGVPVEAAACIKVKGNSMEPVLPDGSTVGVNTADTNILDGKMYALDHDGMLRIKMVYRLPGGRIRLRSFNIDEHPDESYEKDEPIKIIGRVFWSAALHS